MTAATATGGASNRAGLVRFYATCVLDFLTDDNLRTQKTARSPAGYYAPRTQTLVLTALQRR